MSDVNFLARRARLLGRQLSESWMASAGGLLNELADALDAKAGAEAAGEAVAASQAAGQGVGGVEGAQGRLEGEHLAWWGQRSVDAHNSVEPKTIDELLGQPGFRGRAIKTVSSTVTWTVPGRGPMTPQQMADALVEVDRQMGQASGHIRSLRAQLDALLEVNADLKAKRDGLASELLVSKNRNAELGDALDYWRKQASQSNKDWITASDVAFKLDRELKEAKDQAADFRREADERKGECEEVQRRLDLALAGWREADHKFVQLEQRMRELMGPRPPFCK